jgi:rod shape-determining protein MreD
MIAAPHASHVLSRPASLRAVVVSFVVGFILMMLPWRGWGLLLRPEFMALLLVYWTIREPKLMGGWVAFGIGILADVSDSSTLGVHALGYSVAYFLTSAYRPRILSFYATNQAAHIFPILLASQIVTAVVALILKQPLPFWLWWLQSPITALLWLALPFLLERQLLNDSSSRVT